MYFKDFLIVLQVEEKSQMTCLQSQNSLKNLSQYERQIYYPASLAKTFEKLYVIQFGLKYLSLGGSIQNFISEV